METQGRTQMGPPLYPHFTVPEHPWQELEWALSSRNHISVLRARPPLGPPSGGGGVRVGQAAQNP